MDLAVLLQSFAVIWAVLTIASPFVLKIYDCLLEESKSSSSKASQNMFSILLAVWVAIDYILDVCSAADHADVAREEKLPALMIVSQLQAVFLFISCCVNWFNLWKIMAASKDFYLPLMKSYPGLYSLFVILGGTNLEQFNLFLKLASDDGDEAQAQISIVKGETVWSNLTEDVPQLSLSIAAIVIMESAGIDVPVSTAMSVYASWTVLMVVMLQNLLVVTINHKESSCTAWIKEEEKTPNLFCSRGMFVALICLICWVLFVINSVFAVQEMYRGPAFTIAVGLHYLLNFISLIVFVVKEDRKEKHHMLKNPTCWVPVMMWSIIHPCAVQFFQEDGKITHYARAYALNQYVLQAFFAIVMSVFHFLAGRLGPAVFSLFFAAHQLVMYIIISQNDDWKKEKTFVPAFIAKCAEFRDRLFLCMALGFKQAPFIVFFSLTGHFISSAPMEHFNLALTVFFGVTLGAQILTGLWIQSPVSCIRDEWKLGMDLGLLNVFYVCLFCIHPLGASNKPPCCVNCFPGLLRIYANRIAVVLGLLMGVQSFLEGNGGMCIFAFSMMVHTVVLDAVHVAEQSGTSKMAQSWNPRFRKTGFDISILVYSMGVWSMNVVHVVFCMSYHEEFLWVLGFLSLLVDAVANLGVVVKEIRDHDNAVKDFKAKWEADKDASSFCFFAFGATIVAIISTFHLPSRHLFQFSDDFVEEVVEAQKYPRALMANIFFHVVLACSQMYGIWKHPFVLSEQFLMCAVIANGFWCAVMFFAYVFIHRMQS